MSHTPRPWAVIPTNARSYVITGDGGTYDVAIVRDIGKHDNAANARLIAAAPQLLEALKAAIRNIPKGPSSLRFQCEEAIAKAEGK